MTGETPPDGDSSTDEPSDVDEFLDELNPVDGWSEMQDPEMIPTDEIGKVEALRSWSSGDVTGSVSITPDFEDGDDGYVIHWLSPDSGRASFGGVAEENVQDVLVTVMGMSSHLYEAFTEVNNG